MKKLFILLALAFLCQSAFAVTEVTEYYLNTALGGVARNHGSYSGGTSFAGDNLGTVPNTSTPLIIDLTGLKTNKYSGGDVTGCALFYRVYLSTATAPAFTSLNLPFNNGGCCNQTWESGTDVNLLAASLGGAGMSPGTYKVDVYVLATTNEGDRSYGTSVAPLTATFTLAVALKAEITSFTAKKNANTSVISWLTASEKDNAVFQIERSSNATDFSPIGEAKGAGNSNVLNTYSFTDLKPVFGVNYYRLKAIDYNGTVTLTQVVSVNFSSKGGDKTAVYPNPANDVVRVDYTATDAATTVIQVTDLTGRVIISQNVAINKGANLLPLNIASLPSGAYLVKINNDITRFIKM
jgi:hypothetical protein